MLLAVLTATLFASSSAAAADLFVPGKDDRPPGRAEDYTRQPVPCGDPVQELVLLPGTSQVFADTTSGESLVQAYACRPGWNESGPEHIYVLHAAEDLVLDALLADNVIDHDLILLAACHTDSCLVQANTELSAVLRAGRTYYLVVDGYQGAAGPYQLTLETRYLGLAPQICEPGGAIAVDLATAGSTELVGNLFDAPNLVSIDDCSPVTMPGGEVWYALTLAAAETAPGEGGWGSHVRVTITASTGVQGLDLALWLYDGCGPDAVCLDFVDRGVAGQSETLAWQNLELQPTTVYLAVDCRRAPTHPDFASFTLQFGTVVQAERRAWSGVRGLYR